MYGPFFFAEAAVTGMVYLDMLENFVKPMLLSDFQQDGVPCHYVLVVHDYLSRTFPNCWIGHGRS